MFDNRHANVWRLRLLLIPFTLVVGGLFAGSRSLTTQMYIQPPKWDPRNISSTFISFISFVTYVYAVWGATRIPTKVRTFLVFGLAYGMLFCTLSILLLINDGYTSQKVILMCEPGDDPCQIMRTAQVLGSITGCMMVLEVIMTARLGPLDHSLRKHRYKAAGGNGGYQTGANVVIVRPDYAPVQPQVLVPMQQPYPYQQPQQQQSFFPRHEEIQHHPLPHSPHSTGL